MPYLEWVLNRPAADRGAHAVQPLVRGNGIRSGPACRAGLGQALAGPWAVLAADIAPEGFLTSRLDFIGRAGSIWTPRVLETLAFSAPATRRPSHVRSDRQPAAGRDLGGRQSRADTDPGRAWPRTSGRPLGSGAPRHLGLRPARQPVATTTRPQHAPRDRARRDSARHAAAVLEFPRRRPHAAGPHAVHAAALRPHAVQRPGPRHGGDQPRAAHQFQRQLAAEPAYARLARHRHPRSARRGALSLRSGRPPVVLADLSSA